MPEMPSDGTKKRDGGGSEGPSKTALSSTAPLNRPRDDYPREPPKSARAPRVRGPAEALAARHAGRDADDDDLSPVRGAPAAQEEPLPESVKGADFKTLQTMIAKGIQDAEKGASTLEGDLLPSDNDEDLKRHRELLRRRKEEEAANKQREKEAAREKRRLENEARIKKLQDQLDSEEKEEQRQREAVKEKEALCKRQLAAASRIQSRYRGYRSRKGHKIASPYVQPAPHSEPWQPAKRFAGLC